MNFTITQLLLVITIGISILGFNNRDFFDRLKHFPYIESQKKEYYRLLTSGFLHGDWVHLGINMFVLYMFGEIVEDNMIVMFGGPIGKVYFLLLYVLTIVLANIPSYIRAKELPYFTSIGASGAIAGLLFIFAFLYPWNKLLLYGIIPVYAVIGAILYLVYSSWASKNKEDNIDHSAHFYGAVFGLILFIVSKPDMVYSFYNKLIYNFPF